MPYSAPSVGPVGLIINAYADILAYYLAGFRATFGPNAYLGNDSADFQLMSIVALAAADCNSAIQLAYAQQSPTTAVGAGLSAVVANNGLQRKLASLSTCLVTLTGTPGAIINNGVIQNSATGDLWRLPSSVTIGVGGTVAVTAVAQAAGSINALASQLTIIVTVTAGWVSVTNGSNVPAVGQPVETDRQLRQRQAVSTALPSITLLAGTTAAIAGTLGVTRYSVLENSTGATDGNGNPGHSITAVVEGGVNLDVASAIYANRGIGPLMNGNGAATVVTQLVTDPNSGVVTTVEFNRPTSVPIFVTVNVHLGPGGTSAVLTTIQAAIVAYLNTLQIGEVVTYGALVQVAMAAVNVNPSAPIAWVRTLFFGTASSPTTITDVVLAFYQVAQGILTNVVVNSV
jgi:hypothetical protein